MREDYDEIGHYVPSLSRILLLIAVIIAVPLILSTITAFVRNQSNVSTFHDLLATASVNGLGRTTIAEPTKEQSTPRQAKWADPREAETAERAASALPVDYPPDAPPSAGCVAQIADTSNPLAATSNSGTPTVPEGADGLSPPLAANDGAASEKTDAVAPIKPLGATKAEADGLSASAPLSEPIRLPRPRPHDGGTVHKADSLCPVCRCHDPATGGRLWRAAGDDDQQSNRSTAAAMTERWVETRPRYAVGPARAFNLARSRAVNSQSANCPRQGRIPIRRSKCRDIIASAGIGRSGN